MNNDTNDSNLYSLDDGNGMSGETTDHGTRNARSGNVSGYDGVIHDTRWLLENAVLDAIGLLDDDEREAFERSFGAASPEVQAQIRAAQTRFCTGEESLLPRVDAPDDQRERVLRAVRNAIAEEQERIAVTHGRRLSIAGRPRTRVAGYWRTGALGFATAAAVLGAAMIDITGDYRQLEGSIGGGRAADELVAAGGPGFASDVLYDHQTRRVALRPADPIAAGEAAPSGSIFLHPDWSSVLLAVRNLPIEEGVSYQLVLEQAGGAVRVLDRIQVSSGSYPQRVMLDPRDIAALTLDDAADSLGRLAIHAVRTVEGRLVRTAVLVA